MRIFLAGGTGFVGGHLRRELVARGHSVRLLVHRRSGTQEPGIEQLEGDATVPSSLFAAARGCDATINLIGIIREFPQRGTTFERLHVEATRNLIHASREAGISRYLQMSALGTGPNARTGYFATKYRAEEELRNSGLDWTIFRPSVVYGPNDEFVNMLAGMIKALPAMPVIGDGSYQLQPIAADDVARCFAGALEIPETIGQTYALCGPDRLSYNELLDSIARVLGMKGVFKVRNPLALMRLVVPVLQRIPLFPLTSDQLEMLVQGSTCDGSWSATFGFTPQGFESGIRAYLKR
ncbi:NAD-dependent nucleoside diphosphate-sugar epimerase/dehydratase [Geomonas limicola]|uniref:NAD-dependent nucleoside diphosphate-sugar epimerase/dehydratase n=1 Tax=Geomonas limicola TaxID=2740186 RepID=A0A6V8N817_9BACT|nr:complex I NDUFA9 subunit family protein [Geomonas limicola]GFO68705.1 NAD-dependent nucleoside diphosphate-sugar epimerase/dehydratase [Geomonas limicola]